MESILKSHESTKDVKDIEPELAGLSEERS
jgi:hypothetical protein